MARRTSPIIFPAVLARLMVLPGPTTSKGHNQDDQDLRETNATESH